MTVPLRLEPPSPLDYFTSLVAEDDGFSTLEAAIALGQDADRDLDPQTVLLEVDALAARLKQRLPADASPTHRVQVLNRFFFRELGFASNVNDFHHPDNSYLHRVLDSRRGIPVTLAVLYVELAQHIGLRAGGVSFPGHFLVKLRMPYGEVVIDPVNGESLSRARLDEWLEPFRRGQGAAGDAETPLGLFLQTALPREIIARMLRNLKHVHRQAGNLMALLAVQDRLVCLLPQAWEERRDRGLALAEANQPGAALADLAAYLEHSPVAADAAALRHLVSELRDALPGQAH
ncbi:MAG: tetratricopeptide repeat protein [Vitreoscilla sp.]|nr:tetratricopeptide repeat protein [Burkholderiales bacterium]MBP6336548.1 tetratricopeptide repeat protein [Vitreoscilla sp.]MBP6673775.1 tetratricopeptide repeat protein [Vitreoscilla sp.]